MFVRQPIREQLFIPPAWKSSARRSGPMMAYDGMSPLESCRARDAEPTAEPGNGNAIRAILAWISQNLSPDEIVQVYNEIGKLDATGPSDMSKNDRNQEMGMPETEDEPPEFYGKPSPGGNINTSAPRREPQQGAPARSGYLSGGDRDRTSRPAMDAMAFDAMFPDGKRIGLRALGWPANPSQTRVAFDQQSAADFEKLFPDAKRLRV